MDNSGYQYRLDLDSLSLVSKRLMFPLILSHRDRSIGMLLLPNQEDSSRRHLVAPRKIKEI